MTISDEQSVSNAQELKAQGIQAWLAGDFIRSQHLFEQALAAFQSLGDQVGIMYAFHNIAEAMRYTPGYDPSQARPLLDESLRVAHQIGTERYIKPAEAILAWLEYDLGNYATAFTRLQQLLPWFSQVGDPGGTCRTLEMMAKALIGLDGFEPALRMYAAATAAREPYGMQHTVPAVLEDEARVLNPARDRLGAVQSAAVEAEGRQLTLEQAVAYALTITLP